MVNVTIYGMHTDPSWVIITPKMIRDDPTAVSKYFRGSCSSSPRQVINLALEYNKPIVHLDTAWNISRGREAERKVNMWYDMVTHLEIRRMESGVNLNLNQTSWLIFIQISGCW